MKLTLAADRKLPTGVLGLAITPDATVAFATCVDGHVYRVEPDSGKTSPFEGSHHSYASGCALLPDGRTLISAGYDGFLLWHDVETGRCWRRLQAHPFWNWQIALSSDGALLASTSGQYLPGGWKYEPAAATEPTVKVFHTLTGECVAAFDHTPPVLSCAISPDGTHLAAANLLGEIRVWSLTSRAPAPVSQWSTPDFTSWGTIKTHHYSGGIYSLAFSPDGHTLLCCGMGPIADPMAGNGKMTWQRWNWRTAERIDQIKDGQHGSGLMESVCWTPDGAHFFMAGRQAQGTWNAALFSAADGALVYSIDTKKRLTHSRFSADGRTLVLSGAGGQPQRKMDQWPEWGVLQTYTLSEA